VVLDDKLLWNSQIKRVKDRAIKAQMACRDVIGLRWIMVIGPMMTYASLVWLHKSGQTVAATELQNVQRLVCLLTTEEP
jgi:hypothetical protein